MKRVVIFCLISSACLLPPTILIRPGQAQDWDRIQVLTEPLN
ncbi:MAG: hypothetical protein ABIF77_08720 [bacterium]